MRWVGFVVCLFVIAVAFWFLTSAFVYVYNEEILSLLFWRKPSASAADVRSPKFLFEPNADAYLLWARLPVPQPAGAHGLFGWGAALFTLGDDRRETCEAAARAIPGAVCIHGSVNTRGGTVVFLPAVIPLEFPVR